MLFALMCIKCMNDCMQNYILSAPAAYPEGNTGYPGQQVDPGMAYDPMKQPMGPGVQGNQNLLFGIFSIL